MSLSDLASLGSFVSGAAVLASLIFLTVQVRQNTLAVQASAAEAQENEIQALFRSIIEAEDVATLYKLGLDEGLAALSENQRVRYYALMNGITRYYHASWLAWQGGRLDKTLWDVVDKMVGLLCREKGFQQFWEVRRQLYSQEFVAWIDSLPKTRLEYGLYDLPRS